MSQKMVWLSHGTDKPNLVQRTRAMLPWCSLWKRLYSVNLLSNSDLWGGFTCLGLKI